MSKSIPRWWRNDSNWWKNQVVRCNLHCQTSCSAPYEAFCHRVIIRHEHIKQLYIASERTLVAVIRKNSSLSARNLIRKITLECVICFRSLPSSYTPIMEDLPACLVQAGRPFLNLGVDYCGPFHYKPDKERTRQSTRRTLVSIYPPRPSFQCWRGSWVVEERLPICTQKNRINFVSANLELAKLYRQHKEDYSITV